ncbi:phosphotransferase [Micromonospora sp. SH-82]|uniref:phosphotransferase n=1 Tax=Micromonospora sp. SH-82 TaxID=3132938 RepID=UPI003EBD9BBD
MTAPPSADATDSPYPAVGAPWSATSWRRQAQEWIADRLAAGSGRRVTGPVEPRVRPWSVVWRVPTDAGPVWFKANNPATRYEVPLVATLARIAPEALLTPLAVDVERGWTLLPDGGPTLRAVLGSDGRTAAAQGRPGLARWEHALAGYAALQLASAPHVGELLALGVPDHRPTALPDLLDDLLDDATALRAGEDDGLTADAYERLRAYRPSFVELCVRLAESGLPATVQHDDLHDGNVFATATGYRFFDWGDASVAHPLGTLLVTLRSVAYAFDLPPGDPALLRLRDAYLEPWTDRHDRRDLRAAVAPAMTVTKVSRALSWRRAVDTGDPARDGYVAAVPGWLTELFEPDPV